MPNPKADALETELEVFTDLSGQPDKVDSADAALLTDDALLSLRNAPKIADEDLQIAEDEDEEDPEQPEKTAAEIAAEQAGADDPLGLDAGADEVEEVVVPNGDPNFDPKDVQLLVKDAELLETRKANFTHAKTQAEAAMVEAKASLKAAKEAGDTDADIAATEKYAGALNAKQTAENALAGIAGQENALRQRAEQLYAMAPKGADGKPDVTGKTPTVTKVAKAPAQTASKLLPKFIAANPWFRNAKYKKHADRLVQIDKGMAAEGVLNKDTPEYFVELGKRFNREHPGIYKTVDGKPIATGQRQRGAGQDRSGVIPNGGAGAGGGNGGDAPAGKVRFTKEDVALMRQFRMDPDNMDQRREWLINKRALAAKEV